ncbi:MAG: RDD family protein [Granulicella sp.]
MSAAQFELEPLDSLPEEEAHTPSTLKLQAAERLAAHRARRHGAATPPLPGLELTPRHPETRAARIAAAVAERYAHSQSYRAFLAAEAERAMEQAHAAAEVAARTAKAVAATQQQLLSELANWNPEEIAAPMLVSPAPVTSAPVSSAPVSSTSEPAPLLPLLQQSLPAPRPTAALTVRLYEDLGSGVEKAARGVSTGIANDVPFESLTDEDRRALDEEIAFRQSPGFDFLEPAVPLPANLIEFPRQLVASRKARPRLAEGPLREDSEVDADSAQLRIFEVDPDQISTAVALPVESAMPEWSSICLSACAVTEPAELRENVASYAPVLLTAPLGLRAMSALVDGCIIAGSFLGFTTVAACTAGRLPTGQTAAIGAVGTLAALTLIYQLLFFTFSDATPGMRYARIGLCTFSDENPTRSAMRRRMVAILLAACPVGLGLFWACLDDDRLGWHDRISRMYQRSY